MSKSLQCGERHGNGRCGKVFKDAQKDQVKYDTRREKYSGLFPPKRASEKEIHHGGNDQDGKEPMGPREIQPAACEQKSKLPNS